MVSEVGICNLALTKNGEDSITALTDNTKAGRLCNLHYAPSRDMVLRDHLWNFSIKRIALAVSTITPAYEYAYQHALPTDFIRAIDNDLIKNAEWKIEGEFLLSNDDTVILKYVYKVTDTEIYDPLFVEALSARIAAELAIPLTDSKTQSELMFKLYSSKLATARGVDAQEGTSEGFQADAWLDARYGYVS